MPTRLVFHEGLRALESDLQEIGDLVIAAIQASVTAAADGDAARTRDVIEKDAEINCLFVRIEQRAVALIATQQPAARDLREILAILGSAVDLERCGDHAKAIAGESLHGRHPLPEAAMPDTLRLLDLVLSMLRRALAALRDRDCIAAESLRDMDGEVDALFRVLREDLLDRMVADPSAIRDLQAAEWCAKSLERVADHATNIAERVIFLCTGRVVELNA